MEKKQKKVIISIPYIKNKNNTSITKGYYYWTR